MMKAISLWQPWASLMAFGVKKIETRSWPTSHRGLLAICSAKRKPSISEFGGDKELYLKAVDAPFGCVLCVVNLRDCVSTEKLRYVMDLTQQEFEHGDYSPGRYGWMTIQCRKLSNPVPVVGRQGLFNLPADVERLVMEQIQPTSRERQRITRHFYCACGAESGGGVPIKFQTREFVDSQTEHWLKKHGTHLHTFDTFVDGRKQPYEN